MTPLRSGCLVFKTVSGVIPCRGEEVVIELITSEALGADVELIRHAAEGVLHFFREEQGRDSVPVAEFAEALARVLQGFGLDVELGPDPGVLTTAVPAPEAVSVIESDLCRLAADSGWAVELAFFPRLRGEVEAQLRRAPRVLRFKGLRPCVKELAGARRWNPRCQQLSDQIVEYVRECLRESGTAGNCAVVVV